MKAIAVSVALCLLLPLCSCRESPALVKLYGIDLYLDGCWCEAEESEPDSVIWADIKDDSIEVYLRFDDTNFLCWDGTYKQPYEKPDRYLWTSENQELQNRSAVYERDAVKIFEYYDGELNFMLGNRNITLIRGIESPLCDFYD